MPQMCLSRLHVYGNVMPATETEPRYVYSFRLDPRRESTSEQPSKADVQEFINEILGVPSKKKEQPQLTR